MSTRTNEMVALIKGCGYRVFMRDPASEYCHYTDGERIAYAQWSGLRDHVSTVHKPSQQVGTGFQIADEITPETLQQALITLAPHWASGSDRSNVRKYASWDAFHNADSWNAKLVEVGA